MFKKMFYLSIFIITNIVIAIGFLHRIIKELFGVVTFEQIIFNINGTGGALDPSMYGTIAFWGGVYPAVFIIHLLVFINLVWKRRPVDELLAYKIVKTAEIKFIEVVRVLECKLVEIIKHSPRYTYGLICILICIFIMKYIDKKYDISGFINKPISNFIEENYVTPSVEFAEKKNLVLIFLESMERGYSNEVLFEKNLIPDLQQLAKNNTTFIGHEETMGSQWTQAAHVNMLMGIPLLLRGNQTSKIQDFMPGALSIMDVLKQNGYTIYSLFGATGKFADMGKFFSSHGVDNVWERDYFDSLGYDIPENKGTSWGYKDSFIYEKMLTLYEELYTAGEPFCLIMRTVDTHFPHGFAEKKYREFGDVRDTFVQANRMAIDFLEKIRGIGVENTSIAFIGDHLWMDTPGINFTDVLMSQLKDRQIYNVFINSSTRKEWTDRYRGYAAFDMAPTILESAGAKLKGRRFGLGTSLFSKQKTLVERYGTSYINEEFKKHSPFYGRLVNGTIE